MKKIGEWIVCNDYLFNPETLQLLKKIYFNGQEVNNEFVRSAEFAKVVQVNHIPSLVRLRNHEILVLEVTNRCNYSCHYCFEGKSTGNNRVLNVETACNAIKSLPDGSEVRFFGGEPLLEIGFVKEITKKFPNLRYSLVTNGSLMTTEMAEFFADHNFSVGVSYDGMGWQKKNRIHSGGDSLGDFRRCMEICDKAGLKVGISTVITKESIPDLYDIHLEVFSDYNIKGWAYLLGYSDAMTLRDLDVFKEQLFGIIDEFPSEHLIKINDLIKWSMKVSGEWPIDGFCGAGFNYSALNVDGEKRLCPFFMREGNCYIPEIRAVEVDCSKCYIWKFCQGGCLALNRFGSGDTHKGHPFSCKKNHVYFEAGLRTRIKISEAMEKKGGKSRELIQSGTG